MASTWSARGSKDLYTVLGVPRYADRKAVRNAFHALALRYHPDKTGGDATAEAHFKVIQDAYEVLSDQDMRYQHDLALSAPAFDLNDCSRDYDQWTSWGANFTGQPRHMSTQGPELVALSTFGRLFLMFVAAAAGTTLPQDQAEPLTPKRGMAIFLHA